MSVAPDYPKQIEELKRKLWETDQLRKQVLGLVILTEELTRIPDLEELRTCWKVVGNTVHLDASKLKHLILERHNEWTAQTGEQRPSLQSSRYW